MPKKRTSRKRRVLSGLSAASKKSGCKRVSRKAATRKKGKRRVLKKGCRYLKGDGAQCCPAGRKKTTRRRKTAKRKTAKRKTTRRKTAKKTNVYKLSSYLPWKKGMKGKAGGLKKGCRKHTKGKHRGKVTCKRKMSRRRKAA